MIWVLLGTVSLILLVLALRWVANTDPKNFLAAIGTVILVVIGIAAIILVAMGRVSALFPLAISAWALYQRFKTVKSAYSWWGRRGGGGQGDDSDRRSTIETGYLRMELDHRSGALSGEITSGDKAGLRLDDMSEEELTAFYDDIADRDGESARLLHAYMDRRFGVGREGRSQGQEDEAESPANRGMSEKEACEILGLESDPDDDAVRKAHRRLMAKLHPDTGGSTYLASKINQAKDVLLKR